MPIFNPLQDYDPNTDMWPKGGGGGSTVYSGGGGTPGGQAGLGGSGGFYASTPSYDRTSPIYGYRRQAMGSSPMGMTTSSVGGASAYPSTSGVGMSAPSSAGIMSNPGLPTDAGLGSTGSTATSTGYSNPNIWGSPSDFWDIYGSNYNSNPSQLSKFLTQIWGNVAGSGMLNPNGNQSLLDLISAQYANQMGGRQAGIRNQLQSSGISDPNNFALGSLMGDLGSSDQQSQAEQNALLNSRLQNQNFLANLFSNTLGSSQQTLENQETNRQASNYGSQGNSTNWGNILGNLGGGLINYFGRGGV